MASDGYVNLGDGMVRGVRWRVGVQGDELLVFVDGHLAVFEGDERDPFAEAVARAVTPGQTTPPASF